MIYKTRDLLKRYKNYATISRKEKQGVLIRVEHGIYSDDTNYTGDLEQLFLVYKNITLTNESAFYFYELTDYVPTAYQIVSENKGTKISANNVNQLYMNKNLLKVGRQKVKTDNGFIYIFDKERMLIELVRFRSKFSYDFFKEVINNYRKLFINGEIDFQKVFKYCEVFKRGKNIWKQIEDLVVWKV